MIGKLVATALALFCLSASVFTQADEVNNWCRAGFFTTDSDTFHLATAAGRKNEHIYFYNDLEDDCPEKESCRAKAYLVPGDRVVISRSYGKFGCGWFAPSKGSPTVGWIKLDRLKFSDTAPRVPLTAWLGEWRYADNHIKFTHNKLGGFLNVTGDALWRGAGGNVNVGGLDDRVEPSGNSLKVGETDTEEFACKVNMQLIGEFLVAADNMRCGGFNVTFSGVYRKTRRN